MDLFQTIPEKDLRRSAGQSNTGQFVDEVVGEAAQSAKSFGNTTSSWLNGRVFGIGFDEFGKGSGHGTRERCLPRQNQTSQLESTEKDRSEGLRTSTQENQIKLKWTTNENTRIIQQTLWRTGMILALFYVHTVSTTLTCDPRNKFRILYMLFDTLYCRTVPRNYSSKMLQMRVTKQRCVCGSVKWAYRNW